MDWFAFFDAIEQTWLAQTIKESLWYFPAIEAVHLLGLAVLGGAVLVVDLRLLGVGLTSRAVASVERGARPYLIGAVAVMFLTGVPLFLSEAVKCYYNTSFWVKMVALLLALTFTFAVRNRIARASSIARPVEGAVGLLSIALWFTVAAAGRWIGFS